MTIAVVGGQERVLDRVPEFDPKSREFAIRTVMDEREVPRALRSYRWKPADQPVLDQGREGACVGFAWTNELASRPKVYRGLDDSFAHRVYLEAQTLDDIPGEAYSGTSVLAGAKVLAARGFMAEYRWAFGIADVLRHLAWMGPVVFGLNWYTGMFEPDVDGFVKPTGVIEGGHGIEGFGLQNRLGFVWLLQSWGKDHGDGGVVKLRIEHLERLLHEQGEACIPVGRLRQPVVA